jgi:uncharacterized membrane protein YoaK (UPF0700 family)
MKLTSSSTLLILLSITGGYVDTMGYLALQGLFSSHVTGNFVTIGASLINGTSGTLAKLLALPTFCLVIVATRWTSNRLVASGLPTLRTMLTLKVVLLAAAAALAIRFGSFDDGDSGPALATGLLLVSAMAIQNALQRIDLSSLPPSTVMTGTTTQMMIDIADLGQRMPDEKRRDVHARLGRMMASVFAFASGCAAAALLYARTGMYCFLIPPVLGICTMMLRIATWRPNKTEER